jgi:hypothetical protein
VTVNVVANILLELFEHALAAFQELPSSLFSHKLRAIARASVFGAPCSRSKRAQCSSVDILGGQYCSSSRMSR